MARRKPSGKSGGIARRKKSGWFRRWVVCIMLLAAALGVLVCVGVYAYQNVFDYQYDEILPKEDLFEGVKADEHITNIALFGLDTRDGDEQSRSDCMMIAVIDNTRGKIKLISLMRDSLVPIDDCGTDRLNASYSYGGPALAIRTINECFGTDITDYIAVDFEQLVLIIDSLGGVEIDVQEKELAELNRVILDYTYEHDDEWIDPIEYAGMQKLNGAQALCYGRIRKNGTGDDWGRVERQGIVLSALFNKVKDSSRGQLLRLMKVLMPYVTTSLSPADLAPLIVGALRMGTPVLEHTRIPIDGDWYYSGPYNEYIRFDLEQAAQQVHQYIYYDVFPGAEVSDEEEDGETDSGEDGDAEINRDTESDGDAESRDSWDSGDIFESYGSRYRLGSGRMYD